MLKLYYMEEKNNNNDLIDFLLKDEKEVFDGGLSHPSVESEEKQRKEVDEILKERKIKYYCCNRFYGNEKLVCDNIKKLGSWISDRNGMGMIDTINKILDDIRECEDLNPKYQKPLSYLHKSGKVDDVILKVDGTYYSPRIVKSCLVKDKNGEWSFVNKLHSNYSDISELLTTLFLKGGQIEKLSKMNTTEIRNYLLTLKGNTILKLLKKYFTYEDYEDYTYNTRVNTMIGDGIEDLTLRLLNREGYTLLYRGSNGDFIDMMYGVDFIMEKDGNIYLIQVKSKSKSAKSSTEKNQYRYIDIFAGQSKDGNGIHLYFREDNFKEVFLGEDVLKNNMGYLKNLYK